MKALHIEIKRNGGKINGIFTNRAFLARKLYDELEIEIPFRVLSSREPVVWRDTKSNVEVTVNPVSLNVLE